MGNFLPIGGIVAGSAFGLQGQPLAVPATSTPAATTQTIDWSSGINQTLSLASATGDVVLTLSNPVAGQTYTLEAKQAAGSPFWNLIWPSNVFFNGGVLPVMTRAASAVDKFSLYYDGTNYLAETLQKFAQILQPLPELSTVALHLVADDYVSGATTWTSRDASATVFTKTGTLAVAATAQFPGRKGITGWGDANYFSGTFPKVSVALSLEVVYVTPSSIAGYQQIIGSAAHATAGTMECWNSWNGTAAKYFWPQNSTAANSAAGSATAPANVTSKPLMITGTLTSGTNNLIVYYNATVDAATATFGTFAGAGNTTWYIGTQNGGNSLPSDASILEIIIHNAVLSPAQITARAAQFNSLRGY